MKFRVDIDFRKGPSFTVAIEAIKEDDAKHDALAWARANGFDGVPKKITVRPE